MLLILLGGDQMASVPGLVGDHFSNRNSIVPWGQAETRFCPFSDALLDAGCAGGI